MQTEKIQKRIKQTIGRVDSILDVGCGDCSLVRFLAENIATRAVGIDIGISNSHEEINPSADGTRHTAECVKGDAHYMDSFSDEQFDAVVTAHALHELSNPEKALSEIRRILKPEGILFIADFAEGETRWQEKYYTPAQVEKLLRKAGFREIEVDKMPDVPFLFAVGRK